MMKQKHGSLGHALVPWIVGVAHIKILHWQNTSMMAANTTIFRTAVRRFSSSKRSIPWLKSLPTLWPIEGVDHATNVFTHEVNFVNRFFQLPSKHITSTNDPHDLPEWDVPEVAFAGRSNVGKSSLINAILNQPGLVRTSKTPGRTQQLHFLSVGGKVGSYPDLAVVDMPGYGFATAPKSTVDAWHQLVGGYIEQRTGANLKCIYVLIDCRRGIGRVDEEFIEFVDAFGAMYQLVLTKADAVSQAHLKEVIAQAQKFGANTEHLAMNPVIVLTSTKKKLGIRSVQRQIATITGLYQQLQRPKTR